MMCCPLSEADETADVYNETTRVARKEHKCCECREAIAPGVKYRHATMLFDGEWSGWRTCLMCIEIADHFSCGARVVGTLWEDLEENFYPDMKCGGVCMDGLSPEAKRRLIDARMEWLLHQDEAPNDYKWDGWIPVPLLPHLRGTSAGYSPERENAKIEREREQHFRERDLEVAFYWRTA